ncbi:MAG: response regulator [Parvularculaceae bacterium]|nr:response regulator [Parvularculaceae bacterium]
MAAQPLIDRADAVENAKQANETNADAKGESPVGTDADAAPGLDDFVDEDGDGETAPRPAGAAEIALMMQDAEARAQAATARNQENRSKIIQHGLFAALWGGLAVSAAATAYVLATGAMGAAGLLLAVIVGALALVFLAAAFRPTPSALLASAALKRAAGKKGEEAAQLAGSEMLASLALAEKVLDADPDPRLITRRNGVVVYANAAYFALAREAGVIGLAGLPPRIDRLFAQHGAEASKLFRLCRAASSAAPAIETLYQQIGLEDGGARRRFEATTAPVGDADDFVAWRLREMPVDEEEHDALAASYADYLRPVIAVEKSGQIAWANAAARNAAGVGRNELRKIDDLVLGETGDLVRGLWQVDATPITKNIRRRTADPIEATFAAFRRGGVGEGFVLVDMALAEEAPDGAAPPISGDLTEAPFGVAIVEGEIGRDARIVEANKAFADVLGGAKKNTPLARALPADAIAELEAEIRRKSTGSGAPRVIDAVIGEGAAARTFGVYARPVRRRRGSYGVRRTFLYTVEVTDRKRMEQDHAQDQKLKAIGFIAGEVAHDFNNLLQVIQGNCEQLMLRHPVGDPAYQDLVLIRENAQRAANLTKQLLAYSRKQTLTRRVQSITDILVDFSRFLDRAVGEKVKLELINGRGLPNARVDRNQLETAIMNLAVNARDAMAPNGGKVTIRTKSVSAEEIERAGVAGLAAQDHILIEVADTGPGVPADIIDKIFDPFFTTKDEGKGTGLGLSTVHGIIGQMGGAIVIENAAEGGAVFKVYLPAHTGGLDDEEDEAPVAPAPANADYSGSGRILVIEDEDPVRAFVVATLERSGYEVTAAEDGVDALEILETDRDFDLIVSDVMMPEIDGPTFVQRARDEFGVNARVIFMSGYAETAVREQMDAIEGAGYIQKPFPMTELGHKVKAALYEKDSE